MGYPTKNNWHWIQTKMPDRSSTDILSSPNVTVKVLNDTSSEEPNKYSLKVKTQK